MVDVALYWNDVINDLNARDHTGSPPPLDNGGPTRTSRAGALAHLALHDAYFAALASTAGAPKPYLTVPSSPGWAGASPQVAASAACYGILRAIYPSHGAFLDEALAKSAGRFEVAGNQQQRSAGALLGRAIAERHLAVRTAADDLSADERHPFRRPYVASLGYGRHRVDPHNAGQGFLSPYWGSMQLFATQSPVRLDPPPGWRDWGLDSLDATYLAHHEEARVVGGRSQANSTVRTPAESLIGVYWAYDGAQKLGTPPRLYNRVVQAATRQFKLSESQNVRLFALVNAAMADAGIHAWFWKYYFDLWRPVVGIRQLDDDIGPTAIAGFKLPKACDPFWLPFGAPNTNAIGRSNFTPGFPAYPSGHASFGSAALHIMRLYLKSQNGQMANTVTVEPFSKGGGDDITFNYVSEELDGFAMDADGAVRERHDRKFESCKQAIIENSVSRVYLGVHWRFDGTLGGYADKKGNISARFDPSASLEFEWDPKDKNKSRIVGGVPLGLQIAEDIFSSGLKPSGQRMAP